jgi:hypothetical protein
VLAATLSKHPAKPAWQPSATWRLLLPFALIHAAMLGYDAAHPGRFLNADRADERIKFIVGLPDAFASGQTAAYIVGHGVPGDWLPQGLIYLAAGQTTLIVVQVALALLSIVWVRDIGRRAGLGEQGATLAAALYALLPHALVFPHQLASEALFVPLVILAFRASGRNAGFASGLAIGVATLVRPLTLLWPVVQSAVLPLSTRGRTRLLIAAFAPVLGWMGFQFVQSGEFSMGHSSHDLGRNLYERVGRMAAALPEEERLAARPAGERSLLLREYLAFVIAHPVLAAVHSGRDVAALSVKSGIERLTLDYLDLFPQGRRELQDASGGWRARVERLGFAGALKELGGRAPLLTVTSAVAALLFLLFMLLAAVGAWSCLKQRDADRLRLALFVVYIFITAQAVDAAQSRHRAPAEFALCLLAVAGWGALSRRLSEMNRDYSSSPARA